MAEHEDNPPVGSVAEEAARLLDALGGWASTATAGYAARAASAASPTEPPTEPADQSAAEPAGQPRGRCETCGAENGMGRALTCQLCPVCQGIGFLRSVRPETVDRLADLAGAVAATLRDLASERRGAAQGAHTGGRSRTSAVQDIRIEDEDHQAVAADDDHPLDGSDTTPGSAKR